MALNSIAPRQLENYLAILPSGAAFTQRIIEDKLAWMNVKSPVAFAINYLETIKISGRGRTRLECVAVHHAGREWAERRIAELNMKRMLSVV